MPGAACCAQRPAAHQEQPRHDSLHAAALRSELRVHVRPHGRVELSILPRAKHAHKGEDPYLGAKLSAAYVKGVQARQRNHSHSQKKGLVVGTHVV